MTDELDPANSPAVSPPTPVRRGLRTTRADRLIADALALPGQDKDAAIGFMARTLVQATLPHRDPAKKKDPKTGLAVGPVRDWVRRDGGLTLSIESGVDYDDDNKPIPIGIPYGTIPRLLLVWMSTEAVRTQDRTLELGDSLSHFMKKLGMDVTGGKTGSIGRLKEQMSRLFRAKINVSFRRSAADSPTLDAHRPFLIADETVFWWDPLHPGSLAQSSLFKSTVTLSEAFFNEVVTHPIPLDMDALVRLRQSPMALDIYAWLTYRMYRLSDSTFISWQQLQRQFGADLSDVRYFKRDFVAALKDVMLVYPQAKVIEKPGTYRQQTAGLVLLPSPTSVARKPAQLIKP